ncbi:hypothetical protein [uncultured Campylobacter sp.]|uniref:hypothetical protein n=1 Tax=uncultured Campylobacter sp. TaxID=218934 RepID=UPI00262A48DC|nr:hypothetical protein [uncultured Campylobacter sp.]
MKILNFAPLLRLQSPGLTEGFKHAKILSVSPLQDPYLESELIKCEIGAQNFVLALICASFCDEPYFAELDLEYLSGESSVGEEEIEQIAEFLQSGCDALLIDDALIKTHPDAENIRAFLSLIAAEFGVKILSLRGERADLGAQERVNLSPLKEPENFDGAVVFKHDADDRLIGGRYFSMVAKIKHGDRVRIKTPHLNLEKEFILDEELKGTIALLGSGGQGFGGYNFELAEISKV